MSSPEIYSRPGQMDSLLLQKEHYKQAATQTLQLCD